MLIKPIQRSCHHPLCSPSDYLRQTLQLWFRFCMLSLFICGLGRWILFLTCQEELKPFRMVSRYASNLADASRAHGITRLSGRTP